MHPHIPSTFQLYLYQYCNVDNFTVVTQYFEAEVVSEYVIRGNTAVLKCNIPSFVADFVKVEAWVDSDGGEYLYSDEIGTHLRRYVIHLIPFIQVLIMSRYSATDSTSLGYVKFIISQHSFSCKSVLRSRNSHRICNKRQCCCIEMLYSFFRRRFRKSRSVARR